MRLNLSLVSVMALLCLAAPFLLHAQSPSETAEIMERTQRVLQDPGAHVPNPDSLGANAATDAQMQIAEELTRMSMESMYDSAGIDAKREGNIETAVLVTFGNDPSTDDMRGFARTLAGDETTLVLQGLPVGMRSIDEVAIFISQVNQNIEGAPGLVIDPRPFRAAGIEVAPTVMVLKDGKPELWAKGVSDPDWLMERYERGQRGDLGVHGSVDKVAEKDFTEEIKDRIAKVDWEKKKARARNSFWEHREFVDLPVATRPDAFTFELKYAVGKDMYNNKGELLAAKGTQIEPLKHIPGNFYLVIFDATEPDQVHTAKLIGEQCPPNKRLKYIATRIDSSEDGWEEKVRVENVLGEHVYLLEDFYAQRLQLRYVPALVTSEKQKVRVDEFPPVRTGEE